MEELYGVLATSTLTRPQKGPMDITSITVRCAHQHPTFSDAEKCIKKSKTSNKRFLKERGIDPNSVKYTYEIKAPDGTITSVE
jgi:hypothetical protein